MVEVSRAVRRPILKPALRRAWRDGTTLQLGIDPDRAVQLIGLDERVADWLDRLDGTRDLAGALTAAAATGVDEEAATHLLDLLAAAGALEDAASDRAALARLPATERQRLAPDLAALAVRRDVNDGGAAALARRTTATVTVHGAGRIGATVATLLAGAGVGHVAVRDAGHARPGDLTPAGFGYDQLGRRRDTATVRAYRRVSPLVRATMPAGRRHPDIAVLTPVGQLDPAVPERLAQVGVPHLFAGVRELAGVIGPLVLPGQTSCLNCHDLHRTDRDPAWPRVAAQVAAAERGRQATSAPRPCDIVVATLVAAFTVSNVLTFLDGEQPPAVDGTLEIDARACGVRRRSWEPHPSCPCAAG